MQAHEPLDRRHRAVAPNARAFGLALATLLSIVALWPLWHGAAPRTWVLIAAAGIAAIAVAWPQWLALPERGFARFGLLLSRVMNPLLLGVMYALLFVPTGLAMRLAGRDALARRLDRAAKSYWIERADGGTVGRNMRDMF